MMFKHDTSCRYSPHLLPRIYHLLWWLVTNISDHITPCSRQEVESITHIAMPPQAAFFRVHSLSLVYSEAHRQLVQAQGSIRAWHGSKVANWYVCHQAQSALLSVGSTNSVGCDLSCR